jgi:hypothetical protein
LLTKPPTHEASRQKEATRKRSCLRSKAPPPPVVVVLGLYFDSKGNRRFSTFSGLTVTICHSDYFIHKLFLIIIIAVRSSSKKKRISLHSRSGSFPPPSFLLPPSVRSSLPFSKMPNRSASENVKNGPLFPSLFFPFGLGLPRSQVRRNGITGESSAVHTWAKTTLTFEAEHESIFCYSGFLLSVAKSRFMIKSAKFIWCYTFA